jgi:hypothetical protein
MRWLLLLIVVALFSLPFVPAVQADSWKESSDGYWYYWSDDDACWYYYHRGNWLIEDEGMWVPSGYVSNGWDGLYRYDYNRDYRGYRLGLNGYWEWHHNPRVGRGYGLSAGNGRGGSYGRAYSYGRGGRGGGGRGGGRR